MKDRILLLIPGLLLGILFAMFLVCKSPLQYIAVVIMCLCLLATAYFIRKMPKKKRIILLYALLLLVGYLLTAAFVSGTMGDIEAENITPGEEKDSTAVLLISPGEITEFRTEWAVYRINMMREVYPARTSWWGTPYKVYGIRRNLKKVDTDMFSSTNQQLYNKVKDALGEQVCVYNANLFGPPYIETVTREILQAGHKRIVVLENFLIQEPYKEAVDSRIFEAAKACNADIKLIHTFPLWNHDAVATLYENRIMEKIQENNPEKVGIIFVARGCSTKTLERYREAYKREKVFLNKIRENLVKNGYDSRKIKTAYLRYRDPEVKDMIEYLLDSGVSKLVIVAAGFETPCIDTEYVIPGIIDKTDIPEGIEVEYVGAWGGSDILVKALIDRFRIANID